MGSNNSLSETVRHYATVGVFAAAFAGLVVPGALAHENPTPAASGTEAAANSATGRQDPRPGLEDTTVERLTGSTAGRQQKETEKSTQKQERRHERKQDKEKKPSTGKGKAEKPEREAKKAEPEKSKGPTKAKKQPAAGQGGDRVDRWIDQAAHILRAHGTKISNADKRAIRMVIEHESSGDPRAINLWDSNAERGTPSKGLMQTIDPTFDAYKLSGYGEIYHPVHNIIAGVRYTLSRYGSFAEHPGLASMAEGGDYQGY